MGEEEVDSGSEEALGVSRSSARYVSKVIAKFCATKIRLVAAMGFDGLLHVPKLNKVNRKFSLWLLSRIDVEKGTLLLKDDIHLPLSPANLNKLLGIPCGPRPVTPLSPLDQADFLKLCLGIGNGSADGLKEATALVEKEYPDGMSEGDELVFQSAFIMFIMGRFLAPTTQHDVGMMDLLGSVVDLDDITDYNWCDYVRKHLLLSAKKVQSDLKEGKQITYVTGCPLLLQFLYLDCMDFGHLNQQHDVLPRVKAFSTSEFPCRLLNQMIQSDSVSSSMSPGDQSFGCSKVRPFKSLCYDLQVYPKGPAMTRQSRPNNKVQPQPSYISEIRNFGASALSEFLKQKYGDQLATDLVDTLKVHNARCVQHIARFKESILNENIVLADKILSIVLKRESPTSSKKHTRTSQDDYLSGPESGGEDENLPCSKRKGGTIPSQQAPVNYKRGKQAISSSRYARGGRWKSRAPWTKQHIETILSGSSISFEDIDMDGASVPQGNNNGSTAPTDANSTPTTSEYPEYCSQLLCHSPVTPSHPLPTIAEEFPSFDLGFDISSNAGIHRPINEHVVDEGPSRKFGVPVHSPDAGASESYYKTPGVVDGNVTSPEQKSPASCNREFATAALFYKITEEEDNLNLNKALINVDNVKAIKRRSVRGGSGRLARSPWGAKLCNPKIEADLSSSLYDWLCTTTSNELERPWIMHQMSTYIEISGQMFKEQFCLGVPMSFDMFDIAIRRLRQIDTNMYPEGTTIRWRHWLDSNFAVHVLAGDDPTHVPCIQEQFIGNVINYEIERCRMFVVPFQSKDNWCAYMWDMKLNKVIILDPAFNGANNSETASKHEKTISELHHGLARCINGLFDGWNIDWGRWKNEVPSIGCAAHDKSEAGFCTIFLAKNFDGEKYFKIPTQEALVDSKKEFLYEMMGLHGNMAAVPSAYVQSIID